MYNGKRMIKHFLFICVFVWSPDGYALCVFGTWRLGVTTAHQMSWLMSERRGDFSCSRGPWAPLSYVVQIWAAHHAEGGLLFIDVVFMRGGNWPWQRSAALVLFTTYNCVPGTFTHRYWQQCWPLAWDVGVSWSFRLRFIQVSRIFHPVFTHDSEIEKFELNALCMFRRKGQRAWLICWNYDTDVFKSWVLAAVS